MAPRRPRAYVAALPLSDAPELQQLLERLLGAGKPRGQVVMVRLTDEAVSRLDQLVDAGMFGSRSEAAAFLVGAGIEAQAALFETIQVYAQKLVHVRRELRQKATRVLRRGTAAKRKSAPRSLASERKNK